VRRWVAVPAGAADAGGTSRACRRGSTAGRAAVATSAQGAPEPGTPVRTTAAGAVRAGAAAVAAVTAVVDDGAGGGAGGGYETEVQAVLRVIAETSMTKSVGPPEQNTLSPAM
jgi:hypothetical protein